MLVKIGILSQFEKREDLLKSGYLQSGRMMQQKRWYLSLPFQPFIDREYHYTAWPIEMALDKNAKFIQMVIVQWMLLVKKLKWDKKSGFRFSWKHNGNRTELFSKYFAKECDYKLHEGIKARGIQRKLYRKEDIVEMIIENMLNWIIKIRQRSYLQIYWNFTC